MYSFRLITCSFIKIHCIPEKYVKYTCNIAWYLITFGLCNLSHDIHIVVLILKGKYVFRCFAGDMLCICDVRFIFCTLHSTLVDIFDDWHDWHFLHLTTLVVINLQFYVNFDLLPFQALYLYILELVKRQRRLHVQRHREHGFWSILLYIFLIIVNPLCLWRNSKIQFRTVFTIKMTVLAIQENT